jgi:molecular chaperone DnaK
MNGKRVYGIDLGTTYSCIAHVDEHGKPVVVPNSEGHSTTPSVVFFESPTSIVVGQAAKEVVTMQPESCVSTVKRSMGDPVWERSFFGQNYRPQDVSSFILRKVVGDAETILGDKIEDVVITCPAYFGINEKEATKQAGQLAGLNVLYVIPEPTAAALAYGINQDQSQVILVFDLGGGTFDVTLIAVKPDAIEVICTGGDHELGGKDWDDTVVSHLTQKFEEATGISADQLLEDPETYQLLLSNAEKMKQSLSSRQSVPETIRFGGEKVKVDLTRETFDQITSSLLDRALTLTAQEIEKARAKGYPTIDKLLLVGGSTYMPQVIEAVKQRFPFEVQQFDPNQAVAKGAAVFGFKCQLDEQIKVRIADQTGQAADTVDVARVAEEVRTQAEKEVAQEYGLSLPGLRQVVAKTVSNVTSKSFGVVVMNHDEREVLSNLIEIDAKVPTSVTQRFGTHSDDQIQVDLRCMENKVSGQREVDLGVCNPVGEAVLSFAKPLPRSSPIEISFDLGPDGLLKLHAKDLTTGKEIRSQFATDSIMTLEELAEATSRNLGLAVS